MASVSMGRWLRMSPSTPARCPQCRRLLATSSALYSGHNRWSKIKHQKAASEGKKMVAFSAIARHMTLFSQLYGADPNFNPQLASLMAQAKKLGMSRSTIDTAISRGQGRSMDGSALHSLTYELMMPPTVALIVDLQTDNPRRTLAEVDVVVRAHAGTQTATSYLFSRLGRVVFEKNDSVTLDDIMDEVIEAGAEELEEDDDGGMIVWTQPAQTHHVVQTVGAKFQLQLRSADILWSPKEDTMAVVGAPLELRRLTDLVSALKDRIDVVGVYANATKGEATEEAWDALGKCLDV